jgi:hypothetical protein
MANRLTQLPECVSLMTALTDLQVTRNQFNKLPVRLGALKLLPRLNFDCNESVLVGRCVY